MALPQVYEQVKLLSTSAKIGFGIGLLVLVAILISGTTGVVSSYKDKAAARAIAAEQAESQKHRERADTAEAKAKEDEARRALAEAAISKAGARAEAIGEKVQQEYETLTKELERVGDPVEPCERVRRICARNRIPPEDCTCTSN